MQGVFGWAPPQQCADAGKQFGKGERLHQIVIVTAIQAVHTILKSVARSQQENRSFETALSDSGEHLNAVPSRQHQVEKNDVEFRRVDLKESLFTCGRK